MAIGEWISIYVVGVIFYAFLVGFAPETFPAVDEEQFDKDCSFVLSFVFIWPVGILVGMWLISYRLFKYGRS